MSKQIYADWETIKNLNEALQKYDYKLLNVCPMTMNELYGYFCEHINPIFNAVRKLFNDNIACVENEIRAFFGHISDYVISQYDSRKNLEKAYGHFRRINLDIFKIICNELDKAIIGWLVDHYQYDYREANSSFLSTFAQEYFEAKKLYTAAQIKERVGSNSDVQNILKIYCEAAHGYVSVLVYYHENKNVIEKAKNLECLKKVGAAAFYLVGIVSGILGFII